MFVTREFIFGRATNVWLATVIAIWNDGHGNRSTKELSIYLLCEPIQKKSGFITFHVGHVGRIVSNIFSIFKNSLQVFRSIRIWKCILTMKCSYRDIRWE